MPVPLKSPAGTPFMSTIHFCFSRFSVFDTEVKDWMSVPFNSPAGEMLPLSHFNKNALIRTFVGSLMLPRRLQDFFSN